MRAGDRPGFASSMRAAVAAAVGDAIDVPNQNSTWLPGAAVRMSAPGASRASCGPLLGKQGMVESPVVASLHLGKSGPLKACQVWVHGCLPKSRLYVAPTPITPVMQAGAVVWVDEPLFPVEANTVTPLAPSWPARPAITASEGSLGSESQGPP